MRSGTWNVTSPYSIVSLSTVAMEPARCKLDLVGVQEVRWDKWGTVRAGNCNFFYKKGNENHQLGTGFCVHHRILSAVNTLQTESFKLFKRPFLGFLTILTL